MPLSKSQPFARGPYAQAFTLVELLVSMVVLSIIMVVSASFVTQTQRTWSQSSARVEQFREARMAFETITQGLRQATLNPYMTYRYNAGPTPTIPANREEAPQSYIRHSELQFVTGQADTLLGSPGAGGTLNGHCVFFQAPFGISDRDGYEALNRLLCGRGYFVLQSSDDAFRPAHISEKRTRFRLWEYRPPAERNQIYTDAAATWYAGAARETVEVTESADKFSYARPVAENIIALIISPRVTQTDASGTGGDLTWIAPDYEYDSLQVKGANAINPQGTQHLLPPVVNVTLVALDEVSAARYAEQHATSAPSLIPANAFKDASKLDADLKAMEAALIEAKLNYRVFASSVALRNSKWNLFTN